MPQKRRFGRHDDFKKVCRRGKTVIVDTSEAKKISNERSASGFRLNPAEKRLINIKTFKTTGIIDTVPEIDGTSLHLIN